MLARLSVVPFVVLCVLGAQLWADDEPQKKQPPRTTQTRTSFVNSPPNRLLENPAVLKDIKLTESQKLELQKLETRATDLYKKEGEAFKSAVKELGDEPSQDDLMALRQRRGAELRVLSEEIDASYLKILNPKQRERLTQIRLQLEGPIALLKPDLQKRLNLAPDQIQQIREIFMAGVDELKRVKDLRDENVVNNSQRKEVATKSNPTEKRPMREIDKSKQADYEKEKNNLENEAKQIRLNVIQRIDRILTKKQRETFHRMEGELFDPGEPNPLKSDTTKKAS